MPTTAWQLNAERFANRSLHYNSEFLNRSFMSAVGTATSAHPTPRAKRAHRISAMLHVLIGLLIASQAVTMLSESPELLAWASLGAAVALVAAGIYEFFASERHHLALFLVDMAAGIEICVAAIEKFHQHKHYVQWAMLAAGVATIVVSSVRFIVVTRRRRH